MDPLDPAEHSGRLDFVKKHKIMSFGPAPLVPSYHWYHGYHVTMVSWHHVTMNFGPSLGGRRPTYPGGLGVEPPRENGKKVRESV